MVIPTTLRMGWIESPRYFGVASEMGRDMAEQYVEHPVGTLQGHKFADEKIFLVSYAREHENTTTNNSSKQKFKKQGSTPNHQPSTVKPNPNSITINFPLKETIEQHHNLGKAASCFSFNPTWISPPIINHTNISRSSSSVDTS